jgi:catechol 2,3-dioxygenase-like lactoylglutathione lyase family enzyme
MLDHIILTVSSVERSLAFYEAALRRSDTSGASSVFTMRLMITSAWSRMRRREEQA